MNTHEITVSLTVVCAKGVSRADVEHDLQRMLEAAQEQPPYRSADGAAWWINSRSGVAIRQATNA